MTSTCKRGKAAEHIFIARCLLAGLECYPTVSEDSKVDVIVAGKRVQVKTLTDASGLSVRKVKCNSRTNTKIYRYTSDDIDFFAAVDANTFEVFLLDIEQVGHYRNKVSCSTIRSMAKANDLSALGV